MIIGVFNAFLTKTILKYVFTVVLLEKKRSEGYRKHF